MRVTLRGQGISCGEWRGDRWRKRRMTRRSSGWWATLMDAEVRARALAGVRGVIHAASWVSLGPDRRGISHSTNVELTRELLAEARAGGVERFVYTSSLYTLAAGTREHSADESSTWNLQRVDSSYTRTKREAERLVLEANRRGFSTIALCPGMVLGPRDPKPTSTQIVKSFSRTMIAIAPWGGIPIVDSRLLAVAHRRALVAGVPGERYAVVGPYMSYGELARLVASITGRPRWIVPLPDLVEPLVVGAAVWLGPLCAAVVAGRVACPGGRGISAVVSERGTGECMPGARTSVARETIASCFSP